MTAVRLTPPLLLLLGAAPPRAAAFAPPARLPPRTTTMAPSSTSSSSLSLFGLGGGPDDTEPDAGERARLAIAADENNVAAAGIAAAAVAAAVGAGLLFGPPHALADSAAAVGSATQLGFWDLRNPALLRTGLGMSLGTLALFGGFFETPTDPAEGGMLHRMIRQALFGEGEGEEAVWTPPGAAPYGLAAGRNTFPEEPAAAEEPPAAAASPPPAGLPYGLGAGRNAPAPPPAPPAGLPYGLGAGMNVPAPAAPAAASFAPTNANPYFQPPTPYGIQNPEGQNPFIEQVEEFCEGGKVTEDCTGAIHSYLVHVSDTGGAATEGDAKTIANYLDSLGGGSGGTVVGESWTGNSWKPGATPPSTTASAIGGYLDALSEGAAPPPSGEGVASYVDGLDGRIDGLEARVTNLEGKVDALPDEVFRKVEALQEGMVGRLSEEVKGIVEAMEVGP